jgi:aerobic C4-dicarboxylate transport protein
MVVGPIIFCTVVTGITGVGNMRKVGRLAFKALIYFEVITSLALVLGLAVINLLQPGAGMNIDPSALDSASADGYITTARHFTTTSQFLLNVIPKTMVSAFANGDILQILFFSVLFAFGLAAAGERARPVLSVIESFAQGIFWIIRLAMKVSPIAAFGAIAFTVSKFGFGSLVSLGKLVGEFYLTCALFLLLILWPVARWSGLQSAQTDALPARRTAARDRHQFVGKRAAADAAKAGTAGLREIGGGPGGSDRLCLQP